MMKELETCRQFLDMKVAQDKNRHTISISKTAFINKALIVAEI